MDCLTSGTLTDYSGWCLHTVAKNLLQYWYWRTIIKASMAHIKHIICYLCEKTNSPTHYSDVMMSTMASQITSLTIAHWPVYSGAGQRKHQSFTSLAFVWGIHRWPVNSPYKGPVTRTMFPFDDVIMHKEANGLSTSWHLSIVFNL